MSGSHGRRDLGHGSKHSLPVRRKRSKDRSRRPEYSHRRTMEVPEVHIDVVKDNGGEQIEDDDETFISIGIDLGTTYSGVAWALSTDPKEISIVSSWPSTLSGNSGNHKVPSELTYDKKSSKVTSWGYKLEPRQRPLSWFKLGLSQQARDSVAKDQPERIKKLDDLLARCNKEPVEVAADYLRCLWTHTTKSIINRVGLEFWEDIKLKIVLTVPAIWDYAAQELTKKAATMAGLLEKQQTTLSLVGEPEAAALSAFDEMKTQKRRLKKGDTFVVCDAGGGTVDLISYIIDSLSPLRLDMCHEATGGLCGSIFVDAAFERQVSTMLSEEDYQKIREGGRRKMMNDWEFGVKRQFKLDSPQEELWHVRIPSGMEAHRPISCASGTDLSMMSDPGDLFLETGHLHAVFSGPCSKIKDLVEEQVKVVTEKEALPPRAILLVGGFGENIYLRQDLERSFRNSEIQQPMKAWAAVCRGAVMKGLGSEVVVNYISRYNYGTVFMEEFDETFHLVEDRVLDDVLRVPVAKDQIDWFLLKGKSVEKDFPVAHEFFCPINSREDMKERRFNILFSDSAEAETRVDTNVKLLCRLVMSFDTNIYDELPPRSSNGEEWKDLVFTLEMKVTSGQIQWSTRYKGIETGYVRSTIGKEGHEVQD